MIPFNPSKGASHTEEVHAAPPTILRVASSPSAQRYQSLFRNVFDRKLDNRGFVHMYSLRLAPPSLTRRHRFYFSYDYDVSRTLQSNMGGMPRPIVPEGQNV
jgi:hypothetical protein